MENPKIEADQIEAASSDGRSTAEATTNGQIDGIDYHAIVPKPSKDPNDPLNWTWREKHYVLLIVGLMAFQGTFDAGSPTTGFFPQAERYGVPVNQMLDSIAAFAATLGVGALFWLPMANRYGKTPIYFISCLVATLGALGCAVSNDLNSFIGCRVVCAFGAAAAISIGSSTVRDLFFLHERGQKMGMWALCIGASAYLSPVICGLIAQFANWRWMQWLTFFWWASLLPFALTLPETKYDRDYNLTVIPPRSTLWQKIRWRRFPGQLSYKNFLRPIVLLKYPSIFIPIFWYGNLYGFCVFGGLSVLPYVYSVAYGFNTLGVGLAALPFLIGTVVGEPVAGPFSDWVTRYVARRHGGVRHPEHRLHALWFGIPLIPIGLIILGVCLQYNTHWIGPMMGIFIYSVALQNVNTVVTTYVVDCYQHLAGELGTLVNMGRQLLSFYVAFYIISYLERVGFAWAYGIFAILSVVLAVPVMLLIPYGEQIRMKIGVPYPEAAQNLAIAIHPTTKG